MFRMLFLAATLGTTAGAATASTLNLQDTLGTFNLVANNYTGNQEVEGRTWIGNDLTNTTGQFGFVRPTDNQGFAALTVQGDVVNSTINLTTGARADVTGSAINSRVNNGTLVEGATDTVEFDFQDLRAASAELAALDGAAPDLSDNNNKVFGGADILSVTLAELSSGGYSFDFTDSAFLIINVSGTTGRFGMNPLGNTRNEAPNVLWNFFEATDVSVNSVIAGHVLAPNATLSGFSGSSEGTVIADSIFLTNGELHQQAWTGTIPLAAQAPATVPLPAGLPLLLAGLGAMGILRARRT